MRNYDFTPLYRSGIGFDHISSLLDAVSRSDSNQSSYPPYNIELIDQDQYEITMAVAGFDIGELDIVSEQHSLTIRGSKPETESRNFLHQGIAARNFERNFRLAEHVKVTGANLKNGLLHVTLVRVLPESVRPKSIPIGTDQANLVDLSKSAQPSKVA